jgi:hypothetical protein
VSCGLQVLYSNQSQAGGRCGCSFLLNVRRVRCGCASSRSRHAGTSESPETIEQQPCSETGATHLLTLKGSVRDSYHTDALYRQANRQRVAIF